MKYIKERINRNGIRHDHLYIMLDCSQPEFSYWINGHRKMPEHIKEKLEEYLDDIEKINKKHFAV